MTEGEGASIQEKMLRIGELVAEQKGETYESLRARLLEAKKLVQLVMAERLNDDAFNRHFSSAPRATTEERQQTVAEINATLHALGLAILCPKTGEATLLRAENVPEGGSGRYQLGVMGCMNYRKTLSFTTPCRLALIPAPEEGIRMTHRRLARSRIEGGGHEH